VPNGLVAYFCESAAWNYYTVAADRAAAPRSCTATPKSTAAQARDPQRSVYLTVGAAFCVRTRHPFFDRRFLSRTPGPPPFSSMNSTPARFSTFAIAASVATSPAYLPVSMLVVVLRWRRVASARSRTPPKPRIHAIRIVDMSGSNGWAEFAGVFARTRAAYLEHEQAKTELKGLMPEDAKEAIGHGIRAKRSKSGAVSFDLFVQEGSHAAVE
jgi:hypothetical protein